MKQSIVIGKQVGEGAAGEARLLIPAHEGFQLFVNAGTGQGKTYTIRRLAEQLHGLMPTVIFNTEGDLLSLREKYDFVIAGKGRDIPADPLTAELLAKKFLEHRFPLLIDLFESPIKDAQRFVKVFLTTLHDAPKDLWRPAVVILDELDQMAPEKGAGDESVALEAVRSAARRYRKRQFSLILATLRISDVDKTAISGCRNIMIGGANLDTDIKRSAGFLGFDRAGQTQIQDLEPGEFYARGPELGSRKVFKLKVGSVATTHEPVRGRKTHMAPPAKAEIQKMLAQLGDLPKEAQEELKDREQLRARIRDLEREIKVKAAGAPDAAALMKAEERGRAVGRQESASEYRKLAQDHHRLAEGIRKLAAQVDGPTAIKISGPSMAELTRTIQFIPPTARIAPALPAPVRTPVTTDGQFGLCERKILGFLSLKPGEYFTKVQVGALTGYAHSSGGFNNAVSKLTQAGLISRQAGSIALAPGADVAHLVDGQMHRLEDWVQKLGACERKVYELLLAMPDEAFTKQDVGERTGYSAGSGGFNNAISRLNTLGLIKRHGDGRIGINPDLRM